MNTMGVLYNQAAEWKTRYKILETKLHPAHVKAAEMLVKAAIDLSSTSAIPVGQAVGLLLDATLKVEQLEAEKKRMNDGKQAPST